MIFFKRPQKFHSKWFSSYFLNAQSHGCDLSPSSVIHCLTSSIASSAEYKRTSELCERMSKRPSNVPIIWGSSSQCFLSLVQLQNETQKLVIKEKVMATFLDKFQLTPDEVLALKGSPSPGARLGIVSSSFDSFVSRGLFDIFFGPVWDVIDMVQRRISYV